ncbi:manganese efflux pump, partial [Clostridiaceae bacterium UIB06]|nr:manganese efflux pump [Clostridiaceae bacterium UIB06]
KLVILKDTLFIGTITLIMASIAFIFARYLKRISLVSKYADYIGGIILVIFGIKMMFF